MRRPGPPWRYRGRPARLTRGPRHRPVRRRARPAPVRGARGGRAPDGSAVGDRFPAGAAGRPAGPPAVAPPAARVPAVGVPAPPGPAPGRVEGRRPRVASRPPSDAGPRRGRGRAVAARPGPGPSGPHRASPGAGRPREGPGTRAPRGVAAGEGPRPVRQGARPAGRRAGDPLLWPCAHAVHPLQPPVRAAAPLGGSPQSRPRRRTRSAEIDRIAHLPLPRKPVISWAERTVGWDW